MNHNQLISRPPGQVIRVAGTAQERPSHSQAYIPQTKCESESTRVVSTEKIPVI